MSTDETTLAQPNSGPPEEATQEQQEKQAREEYLLLDKRPATEIQDMAMRTFHEAGPVYWGLVAITGLAVLAAGAMWVYQMYWGIGVTGLNRPVMWAIYIANFVYFIGIGVAGTFISAVLRVLRFQWRAPVTRVAETLTVFALATSALFPLIHLGRTWKFYWLMPYPNQREIWPSFHSALLWDMTAILTYFSSSVLFVWLAMIPDLAQARDRYSEGWRHTFFKYTAMGWRGTERQWRTLQTSVLVFSIAIIPVMILMHSIVGWDFSMTLQAGWESTVFGPYFVGGALLSGAAAVIIVLIALRKPLHLEYFLRDEHFNGMAKLLLVLSLAWGYLYFNDFLVPWFGARPADMTITKLLVSGRAAPLWWLMVFGNFIIPLCTLWSHKIRTSRPALLFISIMVNVGMYLERYIIVGVMLGQNELPFDWGSYRPHAPEIIFTIGAFSLIAFSFLIFIKLFPIIPLWEVQLGQLEQSLRRIGRAMVPTRVDRDE